MILIFQKTLSSHVSNIRKKAHRKSSFSNLRRFDLKRSGLFRIELREETGEEERVTDGAVAERWTKFRRVLPPTPSIKSELCFAREGLNTRHLYHIKILILL